MRRLPPTGPEGLVRDDAVHRDAFVDPAVYALEVEHIFRSTWVYVGHASEVPHPGDYRLTQIAGQSMILSRREDGGLHLGVNACRLRGLRLLEDEHGSARHIVCPYHGWVFGCDGRLVDVPQATGQGGDFDAAQFGLVQPPRLEQYRGFVFASWNGAVEPLQAHLGNARRFIDLFSDLSPSGEVQADLGATRYEYRGNWKQQAENSMDGYHVGIVHASFVDTLMRHRLGQSMAGLVGPDSPARSVALGGGHALLDYRMFDRKKIMGARQLASDEVRDWHERLHARLGPERAETVIACNGGDGFNLLVFPNLMLINNQIRSVLPLAYDRTRVTAQPVSLVGVDPLINAQRLRAHEDFYGPAAFGAADDIEMFERQWQGLLEAPDMRWLIYARGREREAPFAEGELAGHVSDETGQRGIWRRWSELMAAAL